MDSDVWCWCLFLVVNCRMASISCRTAVCSRVFDPFFPPCLIAPISEWQAFCLHSATRCPTLSLWKKMLQNLFVCRFPPVCWACYCEYRNICVVSAWWIGCGFWSLGNWCIYCLLRKTVLISSEEASSFLFLITSCSMPIASFFGGKTVQIGCRNLGRLARRSNSVFSNNLQKSPWLDHVLLDPIFNELLFTNFGFFSFGASPTPRLSTCRLWLSANGVFRTNLIGGGLKSKVTLLFRSVNCWTVAEDSSAGLRTRWTCCYNCERQELLTRGVNWFLVYSPVSA